MTAGLPGMHCARLVSFCSSIRRVLLLGGAVLVISSCGGGSDGGTDSAQAPNQPPPSSGGNHAPTISGTPAATVMEGQQYDFTPTASDADSDTLTFSIANKPSWASFTPASGKLTGMPGAGDVGMYSNIQISVSDGTDSANLGAFSVEVVATATGSATLTWTAPTENTDGSPLTDLAGYKIYWGTSQGNYSNSVTLMNPGLSTYVIDQLTPATWYFVATVINSNGIESQFSNPASKVVQ